MDKHRIEGEGDQVCDGVGRENERKEDGVKTIIWAETRNRRPRGDGGWAIGTGSGEQRASRLALELDAIRKKGNLSRDG